jgi:coatomer subunit beta'
MDDEASQLAALEHIMSDASAEPIKLSYGLLRSITDNFSNEIGRGGFGVVYQVWLAYFFNFFANGLFSP